MKICSIFVQISTCDKDFNEYLGCASALKDWPHRSRDRVTEIPRNRLCVPKKCTLQ